MVNNNKVTSFVNALNGLVDGKEDKSNKVTSWSNTTTDTNYPSEKLVKDSLDGKQDELVSGTNLKTLNGVDLLGEGDIAIDVAIGGGGETVLWQPKLDGTDPYTNYNTSTGSSCIASDGELTGRNIKFDDTWSNSGDWELSLEAKTSDIYMGFSVMESSQTQIDRYCLQFLQSDGTNSVYTNYKATTRGTSVEVSNKSLVDTYRAIKVRKKNDVYSIYIDGDLVKTYDKTDTWANVCLTLYTWQSNRTMTIKNVKVICTPTAIFEDDCSVDNTSDYVNTVNIGSSSTTINLTFDSSTNGYLFTGTGGEYFGGKVIPITFQDKIVVKADVKLLGSSAFNQFALGLTDSLNPQNNGNYDMFRVRGDNKCDYLHNSGGEIWSTSNVSVYNNWVTLEVSIDGTSLTGKLYDENKTLLAQTLQITNTYSNPYIFIGLNCNGNNQKYVKNIVVKTNTKLYLGDDIMTMIDTALGHMITNWEDYE